MHFSSNQGNLQAPSFRNTTAHHLSRLGRIFRMNSYCFEAVASLDQICSSPHTRVHAHASLKCSSSKCLRGCCLRFETAGWFRYTRQTFTYSCIYKSTTDMLYSNGSQSQIVGPKQYGRSILKVWMRTSCDQLGLLCISPPDLKFLQVSRDIHCRCTVTGDEYARVHTASYPRRVNQCIGKSLLNCV